MLALRGSHNGEAYEIEISEASGSKYEYQCRLAKGNGCEKWLSLEVVSRMGDRWTLRVDGRIEDLIISKNDSQLLVDWNNRNYRLSIENPKDTHSFVSADHGIDQKLIRAEMVGKVVSVSKKAGDPVAARESLATIEAMKMLNEVKAPKAGVVTKCQIKAGALVNPGDLLFEIE